MRRVSTRHIHWHGIGRKFYVQGRVKVVNRFYEPNASDLEQIIHIFIAGGEAFDDAQNQAQIAFNICFSCFLITSFDLLKKSFLFLGSQQREFGGVHTTDFNFSLCHFHPLFCAFSRVLFCTGQTWIFAGLQQVSHEYCLVPAFVFSGSMCLRSKNIPLCQKSILIFHSRTYIEGKRICKDAFF